MKRAVILHGTGGSPESNWFQWLETELKKRGLEAWLPALPNTDQPKLSANAAFVRENAPFVLDETTLIIGHSSGAVLALILAQQSAAPLGGVAAVSVFHNDSLFGDAPARAGLPETYAAIEWEHNDSLFDVPFDYSAIKNRARKLLFVHSDDDPYVPLPQAQHVADSCSGEMLVIPGQGHFNLEKSQDYKSFPKLIELLDARSML
jgi:hypothetical protein